jgi:hypothetical protein
MTFDSGSGGLRQRGWRLMVAMDNGNRDISGRLTPHLMVAVVAR